MVFTCTNIYDANTVNWKYSNVGNPLLFCTVSTLSFKLQRVFRFTPPFEVSGAATVAQYCVKAHVQNIYSL